MLHPQWSHLAALPPLGTNGSRSNRPPKWDTIRDMLSKHNLHFELTGLPGGDDWEAVDVYNPEVFRSSPASEHHLQHLDVISCWKHITYHHAEEIAYWMTNFEQCVLRTLSDTLLSMFADYIRDENEDVDRTNLQPSLLNFLSSNTCLLIDFDMPALVTNMIQKFYADDGPSKWNWFVSTGSLPSMVFNFIRTRDCFDDASPSPRMLIHIQLQLRSLIVMHVERKIPHMEFGDIPTLSTNTDTEYCICPKYNPRLLVSSFHAFRTETCFSLRSRLKMSWDPVMQCFRGLVPNTAVHQRPSVANSLFLAELSTKFPDGVEFRQTTRYRILIPASDQDDSQIEHFLLNTNNDADSDHSSIMTEVKNDENVPSKKRKATSQLPSPPLTYVVPPTFANQPFAMDVLTKRTRRNVDSGVWFPEDDFDSGVLGVLSTGVLGQATYEPQLVPADPGHRSDVFSPRSNKLRSRAYDADNVKVMPGLKKKGSMKRMIFRHSKLPDSSITNCPSQPHVPGRGIDMASPSMMAFEQRLADESDKSERDINHEMLTYRANYDMFLEQKMAASGDGVFASQTDTCRDLEVERAFLASASDEESWEAENSDEQL